MSEQRGPREVTIPIAVFKTCLGCKWFRHELVKSGKNPVYSANCDHPNADPKPPIAKTYPDHNLFYRMNDYGYFETPDWCPVIPAKENIETLNIVQGIIDHGTPHA